MCSSEANTTIRIGKYLSDIFCIQNDLQEEDALSPLIFILAL
jgi:hypothetical protein